MDNFSHFVITRFNLPLWTKDKKNSPTRTESWLRERFDIFETYCLPSMAAQSSTRFTWLCLFDEATPAEYLDRIEGYRSVCSAFTPVFYDEAQTRELSASLDATIRASVTKEETRPDWIATTNIDNDDAFSLHAVEELQKRLTEDPGGTRVYSFLYGYQYFAGQHLVAMMRYTNNHFLTLTEPYGEDTLRTIVSYRHAVIAREMETVFLDNKEGMWLEVVHASNVANEFRINSRVKYLPVVRNRSFGDFALGMNVRAWPQFWKTVVCFPVWFVSTGVRRLATKKQRRAAAGRK